MASRALAVVLCIGAVAGSACATGDAPDDGAPDAEVTDALVVEDFGAVTEDVLAKPPDVAQPDDVPLEDVHDAAAQDFVRAPEVSSPPDVPTDANDATVVVDVPVARDAVDVVIAPDVVVAPDVLAPVDVGSCDPAVCRGFSRCVANRCEPYPACGAGNACAATTACRNGRCVPASVDIDGDGAAASVDCDEMNAAVHPGAAETCNGRDDNCDGVVDGPAAAGARVFYRDADGDGHGNAAMSVRACAMPAGHVAAAGDCNDGSAAVHPGATEVCNGVDDNCGGGVDERACAAGCTGATYDGHAYTFCVASASWDAARMACEARGFRLVRVDALAENTFVRNTASARSLDELWVGASDRAVEATWQWTDGAIFWRSRLVVGGLYNRWASGEPNDDGTEDCARMGTGGGWEDTECGRTEDYVCERY